MDAEKNINYMINKYGQPVTIHIDRLKGFTKALIQPLRYKNKMYLELERSEIGIKDNTCFLYIGPASFDITSGNVIIEGNGTSFSVSRADMIYVGDKRAYVWAILNKRIKDGKYDNTL